jgi:hypothetical protein
MLLCTCRDLEKNTGRHPASSEIMQFLLSLILELFISSPHPPSFFTSKAERRRI